MGGTRDLPKALQLPSALQMEEDRQGELHLASKPRRSPAAGRSELRGGWTGAHEKKRGGSLRLALTKEAGARAPSSCRSQRAQTRNGSAPGSWPAPPGPCSMVRETEGSALASWLRSCWGRGSQGEGGRSLLRGRTSTGCRRGVLCSPRAAAAAASSGCTPGAVRHSARRPAPPSAPTPAPGAARQAAAC